MNIIRNHKCPKTHKSFRTFVKCVFPYAIVIGDGEYVTLAKCGKWKIHLHPTEDAAAAALAAINAGGCGFRCQRSHDIFRVAVDG